ncbi:quinone-dependent dihydroorotate dehydrogenase [Porifericola rhodea]|uniref:quinone-dependent dihydroorotate dehydrogenase n=1 Tax=Porifericola rhodea TaxID=930972 RepID=UPI002665AE92|nr:quinone-dependent dihydroorotate dehydrogenase [Porifericola rhodea]WKN32092.1 quinone-dependent dihydroorotate dehydrogenase [Porifericola rhodea]
MYKQLLRPLLFQMSPEDAHHFTTSMLRRLYHSPGGEALLRKMYDWEDNKLERKLFGLTFKNPVGLAAGFDKNAEMVDEMAALGFGFVEIGTLTPRPQEGNPKPRLFRLSKDESLVNRMGFNNEGVDAAVERLRKRQSNIIVGGNIGKNKVTPNAQAEEDYEYCFNALHEVVDYFTVNVSSPNTPDLRELQEKDPLKHLLQHLIDLNQQKAQPKPILLKIAPDLSNHQLDDIVEICLELNMDGLIANNTTIEREGLLTPKSKVKAIGAGGLSGRAVRKRSTEVIRYLNQQLGGQIPIIGVGGIASAKDALEKLDAGASLIQLYTGFVYEGPTVLKKIKQAIASRPALESIER